MTHDIRELLDATAYDRNGDKLGRVNEVYINDTTSQPDFVEVNHGLFGLGSSLVPLRGHTLNDEELRLAFDKDRIKDAPKLDADAHLSDEQQAELYRHYGVEGTENATTYVTDRGAQQPAPAAGAGAGAGAGVAGFAGAPADRTDAEHAAEAQHAAQAQRAEAERAEAQRTAEPKANAGDDEIIRSEERLNVDKQREQAGQVHLRKYVVQETETVEVPVEREEVRIERTPISSEEAAKLDSSIGEGEASVVLHEERVNVSKETVPVEKISLGKETVQDTETVTEQVAKERVETVDPKADERR